MTAREQFPDARPVEAPDAVTLPTDELLRNDASCTIPWRADGFEAISVYVDPAIWDRADEICEVATVWSGAHEDIDGLCRDVMAYADEERLSASIYTDLRDELSEGVVAIAFTVG